MQRNVTEIVNDGGDVVIVGAGADGSVWLRVVEGSRTCEIEVNRSQADDLIAAIRDHGNED